MKLAWLFTLFITFIFSSDVSAQWFDAKGRAPIVDGNLDIARNMAVEDALKHALLFTGAQVESISQLSNGLLSSDRFEVRSSGSVRNIQLVSEDSENALMTVHIRADIVATANKCHAADTTKLVALTNFPIRHRQQAVPGAIFEIGNQVAQQLYSRMSDFKGSFTPSQLLPINQLLDNRSQPYTNNIDTLESAQQLLSAQSDSQFLLTGEIEDISLASPTSKWLGLANNQPIRQFIASFSLFDGLTGETVWQKRYVTQAPWELSKTSQIDPASQAFWNNVYGQTITQQLHHVVNDLDNFLRCEELVGRVINTNDNFVTISLGHRNGLKIGDKLSVHHVTRFTDSRGIMRQTTQINPTTLMISKLYKSHLEAVSDTGQLYGDIDTDAIITPYKAIESSNKMHEMR